jgi:purine-nucleoside phosphorylase
VESSNGRLPPYFSFQRYGVSPSSLLPFLLGCEPMHIRADVIMTPIWAADTFKEHASSIDVVAGDRVYDLHYQGSIMTLIRSGVGAPLTGDIVLSLADSKCRRILFTGSVGGLLPALAIGDLMVPTHSVSGDGFSAYLSADLNPGQFFFCRAPPDLRLQEVLHRETIAAALGTDARIDKGAVFSVDSIVSQYQHLEWITRSLGCMGIEMETAATFNASRLLGIRAAALLQFSDVIPLRKTLFAGTTEAEQARRSRIRRSILAKALLETAIGAQD